MRIALAPRLKTSVAYLPLLNMLDRSHRWQIRPHLAPTRTLMHPGEKKMPVHKHIGVTSCFMTVIFTRTVDERFDGLFPGISSCPSRFTSHMLNTTLRSERPNSQTCWCLCRKTTIQMELQNLLLTCFLAFCKQMLDLSLCFQGLSDLTEVSWSCLFMKHTLQD